MVLLSKLTIALLESNTAFFCGLSTALESYMARTTQCATGGQHAIFECWGECYELRGTFSKFHNAASSVPFFLLITGCDVLLVLLQYCIDALLIFVSFAVTAREWQRTWKRHTFTAIVAKLVESRNTLTRP